MIKRGLDIFVSAVLLLLSSPLLLLAAVIIRITSEGPILFRQVRMGRGFRPFTIVKLRTMAHAAEGSPYTLGQDPRITRVGNFLRLAKIDEIPQLWNVLRGDMSLVGPRPVRPELTEEFRAQYTRLLEVRPGLTDPASLKYSQEARLLGAVSDPMHVFKTVVTPDKIAISLRYVERANLWTDSVILAMTALTCCVPSLSEVYGLPRDWRVATEAVQSAAIPPTRLGLVRAHEGRSATRSLLIRPREGRVFERKLLPWNPRPVWRTVVQSTPIVRKRSAARL